MVLPHLPVDISQGDVSVEVEFAMNGVTFDPLLPVSVFDESLLQFKNLRPRLGSTAGVSAG